MRRSRLASSILLLLPLALAGCRAAGGSASGARAGDPAVHFQDVTRAVGIRFTHTTGGSGRLYLPEGLGSGCAFLDYNNDGRLDIYLVNGAPLPGFKRKGPFYPALYRNRGDGTFEEVTRAARLAAQRYGIGVAAGDYDNDGWVDLYLTALGPNALYHNNGDGTFTETTRAAGVSDDSFSSSCAWVDVDRDGLLDLFVCNYAQWTPALNRVCPDTFGRRHPCPPGHYRGVSSRLFHNRGNGTFVDITRRAGVYSAAGKSLGVLVWDFNDDGWPDLMVADDLEPNLLYRNNRNGTFTEMGVEAGVAYSAGGKARAGMGIDSAAIDPDGSEAVLVGNGASEMLALFQQEPEGAASAAPSNAHFVDAAGRTGLAGPSLPFLTFGTLFTDFDLDGRKDILTANGHIDPYVAVHGGETTFPEPLRLFHNEPAPGRGTRFTEVSAAAGDALRQPRVHRGLAMGDYDGDGDPDFLVSVADASPVLLRNDALRPPVPGAASAANAGSPPAARHWLILKPIGTKSNRDGIGTRFVVHAGGQRQTGWVRSGSSYASQSDLRAYFGLGAAARVDSVEIRWPNGNKQVLTNLPVNCSLVVKEGRGLVHSPPSAARP